MTLIKADPDSFEEVGSFKVPGSGERPSWAHPVVNDGRLYLREGDKIFCYSIAGTGDVSPAEPREKAGARNHQSKVAKPNGNEEMFVNGSFDKDQENWEVEKGDGKTAKVEFTKDGPNGESAIRIEVLKVPDETWQLQMYQAGLSIEEGKPYVLTFWVKSNRDGTIKVNCMQNHDPWEHATETEIYLSTDWKKKEFEFDGPWDDTNARMTFADLGNDDGRVYWFAACSLRPKVTKE